MIARLVDGSEFDEHKARYATTLVCGFARLMGYPGRHHREQRHPLLGERAQGDPLHRAVLRAADAAGLPPEHHRLHGRAGVREPGDRQGRREDGDGGRERGGAEVHGGDRRVVRGGQLRDVRPGVRAAPALALAEQSDLGDGRRAGGERPADGATGSASAARRDDDCRGAGRVQGADRSSGTSTRAARTSARRASGTTASSIRSTRGRCWGWASRRR